MEAVVIELAKYMNNQTAGMSPSEKRPTHFYDLIPFPEVVER